MSDQKLVDDGADNEVSITLGLLNAVHENSQLTQRSMASELGIALGLANAYLKRCVKKGLIKVNQIPPNRYSYYLTPHGFSEKARLTSEYLSSSFNFFRKARAQCTQVVEACAAANCKEVVILGVSELTEIFMLCSLESQVKIVAVVDPRHSPDSFAGAPACKALAQVDQPVDAVIVAHMTAPQDSYDEAAAWIGRDKVFHPPLLGIDADRDAEDGQ